MMRFQGVLHFEEILFFLSERIANWTIYRVLANHVKGSLHGEMELVLFRSIYRRRYVGEGRMEIRMLVNFENRRDSHLAAHRNVLLPPCRPWALELGVDLLRHDRRLRMPSKWHLCSPPSEEHERTCSDKLHGRGTPRASTSVMANNIVEALWMWFEERNDANQRMNFPCGKEKW